MQELTNAQKEYFKDSIVRDDNGDLIKVYHGSPFTFDSFDKDLIGRVNGRAHGYGFNFTDSKETAEFYMNQNSFQNSNPMLFEGYINITNPISSDSGITIPKERMEEIICYFVDTCELSFRDSRNEAIDNLISEMDKYYEKRGSGTFDSDVDLLEHFKEKFIDVLVLSENFDEFISEFYYDNENFLYEIGFIDEEGETSYPIEDYYIDSLRNNMLSEISKEFGYDGTVGTYFGGGKVYVCFEPNQVKSIDNLYPTADDNFRDNKEDYFREKTSLPSLEEKLFGAENKTMNQENKETKTLTDLEL